MGILALAADERVVDIEMSEDSIAVRLRDGRTIIVPLVWYPRLLNATTEERNNWTLSGGGYGIHWPDLDEDLSTEGFLRGGPAPYQNSKVKARDVVITKENRVANRSEEKGVWDHLAEAEEGSERVVDLLNSLNAETNTLTGKINYHAENIEKITKSGLTHTHSRYRGVASQCASDINKYCAQIEQLLPQITQATEVLESSFAFIADSITVSTPPVERTEALHALRSQANAFFSAFQDTQKSIAQFREIAVELRKKNLSREFNRAVERLKSVTDGLLAAFEGIESFGLKFMFKVNENLGSSLTTSDDAATL